MNHCQQLRHLIQQGTLHMAPGIFDGLSARLVEQQGFSLIYASGGAIARSTGQPDIGLLSLTEVTARLNSITEVTTLPVIADADTGFGNAINVERTVHLFERSGVAGLHLEDQVFPKRCGHLAGKTLIGTDEMCQKIRIACRARSNPDFVIIARTDAIAVNGFADAIERAKAYIAAGADMIFVEAPETEQHIIDIAKTLQHPKLINMFYGGKTPLIPKEQLTDLGYNIAIIPSDLQRAAIKAMQKTLATIWEHGDSASIADELTTFKEREALIDTERYLQLGDKTS